MDDEWHKLEQRPHPDGGGVGTWDYDSVRESPDARAEARPKHFTIHFGSIAELCFEKGSELPEGDPCVSLKGVMCSSASRSKTRISKTPSSNN